MAHILIVTGSDYTPQVYEGFSRLLEEGHTLSLLSDGLVSPREGVFSRHYTFDLRRTTATLEYLAEEAIEIDAVTLKTSEWLTPLVALIASRYGVIGNTPRTAFLCRSKYHMRNHMAAHGIRCPRYHLCRTFEDLVQAAEAIGGPCVAKPIGGNASYGTFLIESPQHASSLRETFDSSRSYLRHLAVQDDMFAFEEKELRLFGESDFFDLVDDYLVEEFIPGPEISIDSIVSRGTVYPVGVAEQVRMPKPYFVQEAEFMPFLCDDDLMAEIISLNETTIKAFGITDSAVHLEIILSPGGPRVVELACRIGGDNIHDAVFQTSGIHLMYESVKVALGESRILPPTMSAHTAMRYILPRTSGILRKISVPDHVRSNPRVTEIELSASPGTVVCPPPNRYDFLGYIQTRGSSRSEAQQVLEDALASLEIEVETETSI